MVAPLPTFWIGEDLADNDVVIGRGLVNSNGALHGWERQSLGPRFNLAKGGAEGV